MLFRKRKLISSVCPKTGNRPICFRKYPWLIWSFPIVGLASLIWFLIRVVPKPSRATYPCQRVAFPLASGFIIWLFGLGGSAVAFRKARSSFSGSRYLIGVLCIDRRQYYFLDKGQYRYLERGQYNLLGGLGYSFGRPYYQIQLDGGIGQVNICDTPEPHTIVFLGLGALGVLGSKRYRKAR